MTHLSGKAKILIFLSSMLFITLITVPSDETNRTMTVSRQGSKLSFTRENDELQYKAQFNDTGGLSYGNLNTVSSYESHGDIFDEVVNLERLANYQSYGNTWNSWFEEDTLRAEEHERILDSTQSKQEAIPSRNDDEKIVDEKKNFSRENNEQQDIGGNPGMTGKLSNTVGNSPSRESNENIKITNDLPNEKRSNNEAKQQNRDIKEAIIYVKDAPIDLKTSSISDAAQQKPAKGLQVPVSNNELPSSNSATKLKAQVSDDEKPIQEAIKKASNSKETNLPSTGNQQSLTNAEIQDEFQHISVVNMTSVLAQDLKLNGNHSKIGERIINTQQRFGAEDRSSGKDRELSSGQAQSSQPEKGSLSCEDTILAQNGTFPKVALASFPGSGNTWTRYLLERATGFYTGSRYIDGNLYKGGFLGEKENYTNGKTIVIKTHLFSFEHDHYDAAILLIRNPYEAFISEFNRNNGNKGSHIDHAPVSKFKGNEWRKFMMGSTSRWLQLITKVLNMCEKLLVVYYDELKDDLVSNVRRMVSFLGQPVNEERLKCTKVHNDGKFHRKKQPLPFDPYTHEMVDKLNHIIEETRQLLKRHKMKPLPSYERHLKRR